MKSSNDAFLAEVDDFLNAWSLPADLSDQSLSDSDGREQSPSATPDSVYEGTSEQLDASTAKSRPTKTRATKKRVIEDPTQLKLFKERERKRRNDYRDRQRILRARLQNQLRELTAKLAVWQEVRDCSNEIPTKAWQSLARSEQKARLESEARQQRLCAAIKARAALTQELQSFVRDRVKSFALDDKVLEDVFLQQPYDAKISNGLEDAHAESDGVSSASVRKNSEDQVQEEKCAYVERKSAHIDR